MPHKPLTEDQANELFQEWFDAEWAIYQSLSGPLVREAYGNIVNKVGYKIQHWGLSLRPDQHEQLHNA